MRDNRERKALGLLVPATKAFHKTMWRPAGRNDGWWWPLRGVRSRRSHNEQTEAFTAAFALFCTSVWPRDAKASSTRYLAGKAP